MQLTLSDDEVVTRRELLTGYLSDLRLEIARTEARAFRELLRKRDELAERLVGDLGRVIA